MEFERRAHRRPGAALVHVALRRVPVEDAVELRRQALAHALEPHGDVVIDGDDGVAADRRACALADADAVVDVGGLRRQHRRRRSSPSLNGESSYGARSRSTRTLIKRGARGRRALARAKQRSRQRRFRRSGGPPRHQRGDHRLRRAGCAADWFAHQSKLPRPRTRRRPALAPTFARYLERNGAAPHRLRVRAHRAWCARSWRRVTRAALQAVLEGRAASMRNWIEDWWEQFAYLRTRTTMAISINWFGVTPEFHGAPLGRWNSGVGNVDGAAMTIHALLDVYATLRAGRFAAEKSPLARAASSSTCTSSAASSARRPVAGQDTLYQDAESKHIVLLRKGALVRVPVDGSGRPLGLAQLKGQLADAVAAVDNDVLMEQRDEPPLSTLTALERDCWAEEREAMQNDDPINAASLLEVESALFHLTLHEASPATKEEAATLCHGGDGRNKWFDKSFNIILFENGVADHNAEHTAVDAMTLVSIFVRGERADRQAVHRAAPRPRRRRRRASPPRAAAHHAHRALGARTHALIERASSEIGALAVRLRASRRPLPPLRPWGRSSGTRSSPTSLMQMALQLALYRLHQRGAGDVRDGHTRSFFHGRTDTMPRCRRRASSG